MIPPPVDLPLNTTGQTVLTVLTSLVAVGNLAFTAMLCRRYRTSMPALITLSGFACFLLEPVYDDQYHIWFHDGGQRWGLYQAYGMDQPVWVPITYLWCYGGLALLVWRRVRAGATAAQVRRFTLVLGAVFTTFELVGINLGVYTYYGPQAFQVFGLPIWIEVANTVLSVVAGVAFARLEPLVSGPGRISLVAVVPAAFAMLSFGSSFPALVTMSRPDPPVPLLWGAAAASVALALAILHLSLFAVPGEPDTEHEVGHGTDRSRGDRHRWSLGAG
jgi:hypothetical protein